MPQIEIVLSRPVAPPGTFQRVVQADAGTYAYVDLRNVVFLTGAAGEAVRLEAFYDPEGSADTLPPGPSFIMGPVTPTASGATYTLTVQGLRDADDRQAMCQPTGPGVAAGPSFHLSSKPFRVVSQMPMAALAGAPASAPVDTALQVTFTAPVDPTTLTPPSAFLAAEGSSAPLSGSWSLDATGSVATFTPAAPLAPATTYTMTLTSAVEDVGGAALSTPWTAPFTTAP